jgi:probable rRNA maturation factor
MADPAKPRLRVRVTDGRGRPLAVAGLRRWLVSAAPAKARGEVTVAILSNAAMRTLNARYRKADYATDVLSFPSDEPGVLGDIAIAKGVATQQARRLGHSEQVEFRTLALHGLLHLLGYDHETDSGEMARAEERLRRKAGLPTGLIARAGRAH